MDVTEIGLRFFGVSGFLLSFGIAVSKDNNKSGWCSPSRIPCSAVQNYVANSGYFSIISMAGMLVPRGPTFARVFISVRAATISPIEIGSFRAIV